jgi:transposase
MPIDHSLAEKAKNREDQRPRVPHNAKLARPLTKEEAEGKGKHGTRYSLAQRIQALSYLTIGYSVPMVANMLQIPKWTVYRLQTKARERGWRPEEDIHVLEHYVEDGVIPGRPREIDSETEQHLISLVKADRAGREKSSDVLAYKSGIGTSSALRILRQKGLSSVKLTRKLRLNNA